MQFYVAPLAGAWIEITTKLEKFGILKSLPSRERGLKSQKHISQHFYHVAPLAGAWIEITKNSHMCMCYRSLPSRERGLKSCYVRKVWAAIGRSLRGSID